MSDFIRKKKSELISRINKFESVIENLHTGKNSCANNVSGSPGSNPTIEHYNSIYNNAEEILYSVHFKDDVLGGTVDFVSPSVEKITGFTREDFVNGKISFIDLMHPDDIPKVKALSSAVVQSKKSDIRTYRLKSKDGKYIYFEDHIVPISDAQGAVTGIVGIARDITDRKIVEEKLQISEERYRTLVENITDMVMVLDCEKRIVYCNQVVTEITGYMREELYGKYLTDFVVPEDQDIVEKKFTKRLSVEIVQPYEIEILSKNNERIPVEVHASALHDASGKLSGVLAVIRDLRERILTKRAIHASEEFLRALIEAMENEVFVLNAHGTILYVSSKHEELYSIPFDSMIGKHVNKIFPSDVAKQFSENISYIMENERERTIEYTIDFDNKRGDPPQGVLRTFLWKKWYSATFTPLHNAQGRADNVVVVATDITNHKNATQAIKDSEQKYRMLFDSITEAIFVVDPNTSHILNMNKTARERYGYTYDEFVQMKIFDLWHEKDSSEFREHAKSASFYKTGCHPSQWRHHTKEGAIFPVEIYCREIKLLDNSVQLVVCTDISIRKREEEARKIAEEQFRQAFESTSLGVLLLGTDGFLIKCNQAFIELTGYDSDTLMRMRFIDLMPEGERKFFENQLVDLRNDAVLSTQTHQHYITRLGKQITARATISVVHNSDGKLLYYVAMIEDISKHIEMENALMESQEKYKALFEGANDAIFLLDDDGKIIDVNQRACLDHQLQRDEFLGHNIREYYSSTTLRDQHDPLTALTKSDRLLYEIEHSRKDNSMIPYEASARVIELHGKHFIQTICRDTTERKRIESELRIAKERAEEANRLKSTFITNMSHEIRTPLNAILGFNHLIRESVEDLLDEEHKSFFKYIESSGKRLLETIGGILDLSKIESGEIQIDLKEIYVAQEVERVIRDLHSHAEQKDISLDIQMPDEDYLIEADRFYLAQVFNNIIDNAIKFTPQGGVSVRIFPNDKASHVQIQVKDTGVGISPQYLKHIFVPFSQEDMSYSREYEGVGLGLAVTKRLLSLMNADIKIDSIKGVGTTVNVSFPIVQLKESPVLAQIKTEKETGEKIRLPDKLHPQKKDGKKVVLIIEDNNEAVRLITIYLAGAFETVVFNNAGDGLKYLERAHVDFILMDIALQSFDDGIAATERIRKNKEYNHIPIITMTAYASVEMQRKSYAAGADDFMLKPFKRDELLRTLYKWDKAKQTEIISS